MSKVSKEFNEAEFRQTLDRMSQGTDHGLSPMRPGMDSYIKREVTREALKDKKIGDFKQALEALGFRFIQAHHLVPYSNGKPHEHGEWRCTSPYPMAWTDNDILTMFNNPQEFYEYVTTARIRKRAARAGLAVPTRAQIKKLR